MKLLIITNHSYMLWQFRRELIVRLREYGEVVISTPFTGHVEDLEALGCRCVKTELERRSVSPGDDLRLYRFYKRLLREEAPDLVVTYSIKPNIYAGCLCRRMGIPYAVNVQGLGTAFQRPAVAQAAAALYRRALRDARVVFFENCADARKFTERGIVRSGQVTVLPGAGVNLEYYAYRPYPEETEGIRFLYMGRFMREKGVEELFAAARETRARYGDRVRFDLVGFFEEEYQETLRRLEAEGIVTFHGAHTDPRPWYAAAHCVVLPSYHEGMSNVLLEAAATGRALVTSDIPGCREAVEDGVTGLLTPPRKSGAFRDALWAFMELDAEQRAEMGRRGRRKMEAEFDKGQVVRRTLEALGV